MKTLKNKKGFTLVELLAVIVILALIMAIAIYSISGVLNSSRQSVFKETAAGIIRGVKMQLTINNKMENGKYYFDSKMLESGGTNPPFGGEYNFYPGKSGANVTGDEIATNSGVYKATGTGADDLTCSDSKVSFVVINNTTNTHRICLTTGSGNRYIDGTEADVLGSSNNVIYPS